MARAGSSSCNISHVVTPAQYFIGNLFALSNIANNNLFAFGDHDAVDGTGVMGGA
jgi:hypothetical protein